MNRTCLLIALVVLMGLPATAMIRTLAFSDLVKQADFILIAEVTQQDVTTEKGKPFPKVKTLVKIEKLLKGKIEAKNPLEFSTMGTKEKFVEDSPIFPEKGQRALLFLKKGKTGYDLVNGIQGRWPLKPGSDKTLGMGFRYSILQVEEEVKKP